MALQKHFPYETLKRVRQLQQEQKAVLLSAAEKKVQVAEKSRAVLSEEQQQTLSRTGELLRGPVDPSSLRRYFQYARHLGRLGDAQDAQLRELNGEAAACREELLDATRNKRMMERLGEKHDEAKQYDLRCMENQLLDETATIRAGLRITHVSDKERPNDQ